MVPGGFGVGRDLGGMGRADRTRCSWSEWFLEFGCSSGVVLGGYGVDRDLGSMGMDSAR